MAEMLGYTPDEMKGRSVFTFIDKRAAEPRQYTCLGDGKESGAF
jgi:hypothetical protein